MTKTEKCERWERAPETSQKLRYPSHGTKKPERGARTWGVRHRSPVGHRCRWTGGKARQTTFIRGRQKVVWTWSGTRTAGLSARFTNKGLNKKRRVEGRALGRRGKLVSRPMQKEHGARHWGRSGFNSTPAAGKERG